MALPLPSTFVEGIVAHVNSDHRAQLIDLAHGLAGQHWVEDARLITADTEGVDLQVVGAERSEQLRIVFDQPIARPNEFRPAMIVLIHRAQAVLGKELLVEEEE